MSAFPIAVLISGNGSNLQAILDAIANKKLAAEVKVVISNKPDAYGLQRAAQAGVATEVIVGKDYADRSSYDQALHACLEKYAVELVVLAGFMRILSPEFVQQYHQRLINIHPSLLPKYRGTDTHARVLAAGETEHGTSIHFVTEELDAGPLIAQAKLTINPDDTPESLQKRIQALEHQLYPEVIAKLASRWHNN